MTVTGATNAQAYKTQMYAHIQPHTEVKKSQIYLGLDKYLSSAHCDLHKQEKDLSFAV